MLVPKCNYSNPVYRYGFQGQEKDNEIKGIGNSINYKFRMHDPRVGRFFAVNPLAGKYPYNSTYAFQENKMGLGRELEGLELTLDRTSKDGKTYYFTYRVNISNNYDVLSQEQIQEISNERKNIIEQNFSGELSDGKQIVIDVVFDDEATIIWDYVGIMNVEDEYNGNIQGVGYTDENGNIKNNRTQVKVSDSELFPINENTGKVEYSRERVNEAAKTGAHEDGHVMGLEHPGYTTDKELRQEMYKDKNNLMREYPTGTNILKKQRDEILNNYFQQNNQD